MQGNPIHIINVSIQSADTEEDDALVTELTAYTQSKVPPPSTLTTPSHPPSVCVLPLCLKFKPPSDPLSAPLGGLRVVVCDGAALSPLSRAKTQGSLRYYGMFMCHI
jgi:hypothetical protein